MESVSYSSKGEEIFNVNENKTLIALNNSIYYGEGKMQSNGIMSLTALTARDNTAVIDSFEYQISDRIDISSLLGCNIEFFYKSENNSDRMLLWAKAKANNKILEINATDLLPDDSKYNVENIVYLKNGKRTDCSIYKYADIFYNNMLYNSPSVIKPKSGIMRLIDNDYDGVYDIVIIEEFKNIFITSVSITGGFIADKYGDPIFLDEYKNVKIIQNGKVTDIDYVKNNCVASYIESPNKEYLYVYINGTQKNEVLEAVGEKDGKTAYTFAGKEYILASSYEKLLNDADYLMCEAVPGRRYLVSLDMAGNIAALEKAEEPLMYAYLIKVAADDTAMADRNSALLRLLLETGEKITAATDKKITVDGVAGKTGSDLLSYDKLTNAYGVFKNQVVKVSFTSEGKLKEIDFADDCTSEYGYDNTKFTCNYTGSVQFNSKHSYMIENKYALNRDTVVFAKYTNLDDDEPYVVLKSNYVETDHKHNVSLYDCDETFTVGALSVILSADAMVEQRVVLVDKTKYQRMDDGNYYMHVDGYSFGASVSYTELNEDVLPKDLKRGDILKIALYDNRLIYASRICSLKTQMTPFVNDYNTVFCTIFGEVYSVGSNGILTLTPEGYSGGKLLATSFKGKTYLKVSIYDSVNDEITTGSISDLVQVSEPQANGELASSANNTRVFILRRNEYALDAVIVYY